MFPVIVRRLIAIAGVAAAAAACLPASAAAQGHSVVWAVGDAQAADVSKQEAVASMIQTGGLQRLLFLGDLTEDGTAAEYANTRSRQPGVRAPHPHPGDDPHTASRDHERYRTLQTLYGRARNATRVRLTLVRRDGKRCCEARDALHGPPLAVGGAAGLPAS